MLGEKPKEIIMSLYGETNETSQFKHCFVSVWFSFYVSTPNILVYYDISRYAESKLWFLWTYFTSFKSHGHFLLRIFIYLLSWCFYLSFLFHSEQKITKITKNNVCFIPNKRVYNACFVFYIVITIVFSPLKVWFRILSIRLIVWLTVESMFSTLTWWYWCGFKYIVVSNILFPLLT